MDNYIGPINAEWVDPAVELPPDGWRGLAINSDGDVVYATAHVPRVLLGCLVAWLRIGGPSDAIPRAKVQAAVDAVKRSYAPCGCGHGQCLVCYLRMDHSEAIDYVVSDAVGWISHHTGVTPKEVK